MKTDDRITLDDVEMRLSYGRNFEQPSGLNAELLKEWRESRDYPFRNQKGRPWTLDEHIQAKLEWEGKCRA